MNFHRTTAIALLVLAASLLLSPEVLAKDEACTGVAKTCTKDKLYDKEIGGSTYSCYDCKQLLCRDGGDGPVAGTKTESVCTEKSTSFTPITDDDSAFDTTTEAAPENDPVEQEDPGTHDQSGGIKSELVIMPPPPSECSSTSRRMCAHNGAVCGLVHDQSGKASEVCRWSAVYSAVDCKKTMGIWTSASSKYAKNHPNAVKFGTAGACLAEIKNIQKMMADKRRYQSEQTGECDGKSAMLCANRDATCDLVHDRSGKANKVCRWSSANSADSCKNAGGIWTTASSKYARNNRGAVESGSAGACITEVNNILRNMTDKDTRLAAPSNLAVRDVTRTTLTLTWSDNSDREFGVEVYRMDLEAARQGRTNGWEFIGLFEERIMDRVEGTGLRSDEDYELTPATAYCYKLRTFFGFDRKEVSDYSENVCTKTKDP